MTDVEVDSRTDTRVPGGGFIWGPVRLRDVLIALLAGLLVAGIGAYSVKRENPVYLSRATLLIDQPRAISVSPDDGVILKLSRLRLKYAGLVKTSRITTHVAKELKISQRAVARSVGAVLDPLSLLLVIEARTGSASLSPRIAQRTAQQVINDAQVEQESLKVPQPARFAWSLVDEATPATKVSPNRNRILAVGSVGGLLAAAGVFVLVRLVAGRRRQG